jgi:hypothetical protein
MGDFAAPSTLRTVSVLVRGLTSDGGLDEFRRQQSQRNHYIQMPLAAVLSCSDVVDARRARLDL